MKINTETQTIAEMFVDMADVLCENIDHDGLSMLMHYCADVSGIKNATVALLRDDSQPQIVVSTQSPQNNQQQLSPVALRSLHTMRTEMSVAGNTQGLHYEYAFPLRVRGRSLGVIVLSSDDSRTLSEHIIAVMQSIADMAATTIEQTNRVQQARTLVSQLQNALDSRVIIEQAKGIVAAKNQIDVSTAFFEIRSIARREQRPVHSVASEIVNDLRNITC